MPAHHQMQAATHTQTLWKAVLQLQAADAALKRQLHAALSAPSSVRGMLVALRLLLLNKLQQAAASDVAVSSGVVCLAQLVAAVGQRLQIIIIISSSSSSSSRCQHHSLQIAVLE
jgi:hypothetical protein